MNAIALQGNMSQGQRQRAMQGFREGRYNVLVATDIAARGIDVAGVSHVINYDVPNTPDAYTHRIGRTGRAEQSGKACTFVTGEDFAGVQAIERKLNMQIPRIKLKGFSGGVSERATGRSQGRRQGGGGNKKPSGRRNFAGAGSSRRPAQAKSTTTQSQAPQESFGAGVGGATSGRSGKPKHKLSKAGKRRQRMRSGAGAGSRRGKSGGRGR
jgi:superfamily II DNA/RNA helicase